MMQNLVTSGLQQMDFSDIDTPWTGERLGIHPFQRNLLPARTLGEINPLLSSTLSSGFYIPYESSFNETSLVSKKPSLYVDPEEIHDIAKEILKSYEDAWNEYIKGDIKRMADLEDDL